MLKKLIRYTRGYLRFCVKGPYPERFINLCARGGVGLWEGCRGEECFTAGTALRHQKQIEYYASKAGLELTVQQCRGAKTTARRYRRRTGLWLGAVALCAGLLLMSRMVWRIEITGAQHLPQEALLAVLAENGVHTGSWASGIDAREVERRMQVGFADIAWIAVNIEGSTATVVIEEAVAPPATVDDGIPTNVVAAKTGFITRVEAYDGSAVVAPGDTVREGQLLISGIMDNAKGESRTAHARGRIVAETRETITVTIPYRQETLHFNGLQMRRYLTFFGLRVPLQLTRTPAEPYRLETLESRPRGLAALLPFTFIREQYLLMKKEYTTITLPQAQQLAQHRLQALEGQQLAGFAVLSRTVTGKELPNGWQLTAEYLCEGEIGREQAIPMAGGEPEAAVGSLK